MFRCKAPKLLTEKIDLLFKNIFSPLLLLNLGDILPASTIKSFYFDASLIDSFLLSFKLFNFSTDSLVFLKFKVIIELELLRLVLLLFDLSSDFYLRWLRALALCRSVSYLIGEFLDKVEI